MTARCLAFAALLSAPACAALQEPSAVRDAEPDAERETAPASRGEVEGALARLRAAAAAPRVPEAGELRFEVPAVERWFLVAPGGATLCALPCARPPEELRGARLERGYPAGAVSLPLPEYLTSPGSESAVVRVVSPRGSPTGALVLGIAGGNALVFGGALALGFCRESEGNEVQSEAGCAAVIGAALGGAAALAVAIGWGTWSRRARLELSPMSAGQ